jgi:hypothetical protein
MLTMEKKQVQQLLKKLGQSQQQQHMSSFDIAWSTW